MPADIQGKVVIVTGGATGIGRAAAIEFGAMGGLRVPPALALAAPARRRSLL